MRASQEVLSLYSMVDEIVIEAILNLTPGSDLLLIMDDA